MSGMGEHGKPPRVRSTARGGPLRRAWIAAWLVFLSMAATTMTFQVFHAIKYGAMPWPLAVLEGIVPLAISIGVLEVVSAWEDARWWAHLAAYLITAGGMFMSAAATGAVVLQAAPPHMSGLFGVLLDGAALLAIHFILTGPRAADERMAQEAAQLAATERAEAGERASLRRELHAVRGVHETELRDLRDVLEAAQLARTEAERQAEQAEAKAASFARKLERNSGPKGTRNAGPAKGRNAPATAVPSDVDARAEALRILADNPDISGAKLGEMCGKSERWGQLRKSELASHVTDGGTPQ